ncbi:hypothetical protein [Haladaptatus sp. DYF46]|uniref:hypothetical protein n=1 Tax=Haladaptatus sp. DYF46 TaxID=2886041 RepID=UPI001E627F28|nr:hypothetical protein [Haladaptatus sp. DYF46]
MVDSIERTRDEQPENRVIDDHTEGDLQEITCRFTEEQTDQRRKWVEENLLPHLETIEEHEDGFSFVFDRNPEAYTAVTEVAWKETQCCSWATFEIELPPSDDSLKWNIRSDRKEGVDFFREKFQETLQEFEDAATGD